MRRVYSLALTALTFFAATSTASAANPAETEKNFGGLFDFEIPFSPVTDEVVQDFIGAYDQKDGLTQSLTEKDRLTPRQGSLRPTSNAAVVITKATSQFIRDARHWVKLKCAIPNMNLLESEHRLQFTGATKLTYFQFFNPSVPKDEAGEKDFFKKLNAKYAMPTMGAYWEAEKNTEIRGLPIYKCKFQRSGMAGDQPLEPLDSEIVAGDDWQMTFNESNIDIDPGPSADPSGMGMTLEIPKIVTVHAGLSVQQISTGKTWQGTTSLPETHLSFQVVGNWLVPFRTHELSKGFAVPVARFDRTTGEITGYYDFGMLFLKSFPKDQPIYLSSVMSAKELKSFSPTNRNPPSLGTRGTDPKQINHYLAAPDFPVRTKYWNYDRLPIGSVHFMANSLWRDPQAASWKEFLIVKTSTDVLVDLYLRNLAWINTYDHFGEPRDQLPHETIATLEDAFQGNCVKKPINVGSDLYLIGPADRPLKMWFPHEIIIGGEEGRDAIFNKSETKSVFNYNCP